jgi:hypothetical protein
MVYRAVFPFREQTHCSRLQVIVSMWFSPKIAYQLGPVGEVGSEVGRFALRGEDRQSAPDVRATGRILPTT